MSNRLGSQTQSSYLSVDVKSTSQIIPHPGGGGGESGHHNQRWIYVITGVVCGIMVIIMIMVVCLMCQKHQQRQTAALVHQDLNGRRGLGSFSGHGKDDGVILSGMPLVTANPNTYHVQRRLSANSAVPSVKLDATSASAVVVPVIASQNCLVDPKLSMVVDPALSDRLRNVIQQDSSSERDSGTGDSRKSRDNLEDDDDLVDHAGVVVDERLQPLSSPLLMVPNQSTRDGGGESTVSLTEFEDTNLTHLDYEDLDDLDEETGCGEAMLSASNSIASSESLTGFSESRVAVSSKEKVPPEPDLPFRTFQPHRSLSRDFLNGHSRPLLPPRPPVPRTNPLKKRSSAIELNGQKHLEIEVGNRTDESQQHPLDPIAYRGGHPTSSTPSNKNHKGLEVNEKLLEYSLNSTDYSIHETLLGRQNGRPPPPVGHFVNSLPRRKQSRHRKKERNSRKLDPKEELYTTVPQKDDKMF